MSHSTIQKIVYFVLFFSIAVIMGCVMHGDNGGLSEGLSSKSYLNFPPEVTPNTPHDIDSRLQQTLTQQQSFDEVQRLFDILSWQNFIALNWPRYEDGRPMEQVSGSGERLWQGWKESYEVFKEDGSKPKPWGVQEFPPGFKLEGGDGRRPLFRTNRISQMHGANVDDEFDQAFTGPIWDQSGNMVRYEVLINEAEFDYLVLNELYNIDGQITFSKKHDRVTFPKASRNKAGAVEAKLAWKVMDVSRDILERFLTQEAYIFNDENKSYSKALVGLVGMHISMKTASSPQWVWATFEHVDNTEANPLVEVNGKKLKPSFNDPDCQICPINVYPSLKGDYTNKSGVQKNQIQRVLPIPMATQALNKQVQWLLAEQQSALQYYQLIGTQWPTDPAAKPYPVDQHSNANIPKLPEAVTNKSGGVPTPTYLTNMVMETYFQGQTQTTTKKGTSGYNELIANAPAWNQIQGFKTYGTNNQRILSTESCIGCHYSGAIATGETMTNGKRVAKYGEAGTSDFSWLLQLKAHFKASN